MVVTPIPLGTSAQDWARLLNFNFSIMDYHNHLLGNSLNIDSKFLGSGDLYVNNQNIRNVTILQFSVNNFADTNFSLFVNATNDLCYRDSSTTLQITSGAALNIGDQPEGFTVIGTVPVAIFDPSLNALKFFNELGNNSASLQIETLNCEILTSSGTLAMTDINQNAVMQNTASKERLFGVDNLLPVINYRAFDTSFRAYETADIYKISENGVFYFDDVIYNVSNNLYDASYYLGAKNLIVSNSSTKGNKKGIRYYTEEVSYPIGLITRQTFIVVPLLKDLVSFVPKIVTTSTAVIGIGNPILGSMPLPTFNVIYNDTSVEVAVDINLSPLQGIISPNVILKFHIVYADKNFSIKDD